MAIKINSKNFFIILTIFFLLFVFAFLFSQNTASKNSDIISKKENATIFTSVTVEPNKIKVGEVQTTRVEIESVESIEKISAQIPFEGSYDEIAFKLIEGDNSNGVWEAKWTAHNTLTKEYETKIIAVTFDGEIETTTATWWDDTETTWLEGWNERRKITLTETSGSELTDYQVPVDLTTGIYDNTGLVGSWHFSEGTGTFAADSSGQGNNGTIYNGEIWTTNRQGEANSAISFDGNGNYVKIENSNASGHSLDLRENFTISSWIYANSLSTFSTIVGKRNSSGYQYQLRLNLGYISLLTSSGSITSDLLVDTGKWHYVSVVRDTTSGMTTLYLDGRSYSTVNLGIAYQGSDVTVGKNADGTHVFNGSIDEVRIYNRALSADEIKQLYGEGKARLDLNDLRFTSADGVTELPYWLENDSKAWVKIPTLSASADTNIYYYFGNPDASAVSSTVNTFIREISGLAGSWNFDEGTGTTAYDASGNTYSGALINGPTWVAGKSGSALSFDGSDDYIDAGDVLDMGTSDMTINVWFKRSVSSAFGFCGMVTKLEADVPPAYDMLFGGGYLGGNSFEISVQTDETPYINNQWHLSTLTQDRDGNMTLYVDGGYIDSTDISVNADINIDTSNSFFIGAIQDETGIAPLSDTFFLGSLDEVHIYKQALSPSEISDVYNNAVYATPTYPGFALVHKYISSEPTASISVKEEKCPTRAGATGVSGGGPLAF